MDKITQLENSLKSINQARFQTLVSHLLYLQGNKFLGAPGAVVGKEKTSKGSPDAFFINDDKYIFVECTTQEKLGKSKSFFEKLSKDIEHCFDDKKTKIEKEKIDKVVLACTEKITPEEDKSLREKVKSYNNETKFEILNIQNLPFIIFEFPRLAEEYLGVVLIKGEIFTLDEFLVKTTKGLQPALTNEFIGREEELKKCIEVLSRSDRMLISGGAGVGKSKLAVKILEELAKEGFNPIVIQSSAIPLWDDLIHLFQSGKSYIVLFDDANKSIQNLNYLLSIVDKPKAYTLKVIITSRDYIKKQVVNSLESYSYEEIVLSEFKDEDIEKIILKDLPNLKYYLDIKRSIIELAKGNARVALMATHSVVPGAETNYLSSPVLLYEEYFKKIEAEIGVFNNPIILKSLAITSFFGLLDRNNEELKATLESNFDIDWNDLWSAIMELNACEILDVYSNEIVKVSDQVLATYSFYKCFIDDKSAVINYAKWIETFIQKYPSRISSTLVDVNNTFAYTHVRELVIPHLNQVVINIDSEDKLYSFYTLFWFYKGRECLLYLKKWIANLADEQAVEVLKFTFVHNDHTTASQYFALIKNFWNYSNELLKPSIEIILELLQKQPSRLSEVLKFMKEDFKYKLRDRDEGYVRQNILINVLLDTNLSDSKKLYANGIFLNVVEDLLGWHYTESGPFKGKALTIYNFDLYKSDELIKLRQRILNGVYDLFEFNNEQIQKILRQIVYPGGEIDNTIYLEELPIYEKIISQKLDERKYAHCEFVKELSKHFESAGAKVHSNWNTFINSNVMKLSQFLSPDWEIRDDKSIEELEQEKRDEFDKFIVENDWKNIEELLYSISELYGQKSEAWHIEYATSDIYVSIAKKGSKEFADALRLFFSGKVMFSLGHAPIIFALQNNILSGKEILNIMHMYDFSNKNYWISSLSAMLPKEQVNDLFLTNLIKVFAEPDKNVYTYNILDYKKYSDVFEVYKHENKELSEHNVITYLSSLILKKTNKQRYAFGYHFCVKCAPYFKDNIELFKEIYLAQKDIDTNFDHDGKELEEVLKLDSNLFIQIIEKKVSEHRTRYYMLRDLRLDYVWTLPDYEEIIEKSMNLVIKKESVFSNMEHTAVGLFTFRTPSLELKEKAITLLSKYLEKNSFDKQSVLTVLNIVMHKFDKDFVLFLRKLLLLNNDFELFKRIHLSKGGMISTGRVPSIQLSIDLYTDIITMINELPDTLSYTEHIDYLEKSIVWSKKEIEQEQKREFMEEHY